MTLDSHPVFTPKIFVLTLLLIAGLSTPAFSEEGFEGAFSEQADSEQSAAPRVDNGLTREMESIKKDLLELRRDLVVLEEDLLFPASSQVAVFVGVDAGALFQLDAVTLKINGKEVTHHLYTQKQVDALYRGGVQKLYTGNVKQGENTVTAFFTGRGPAGRDYRRASSVTFEKTFEPAFVELKVTDSEENYQPEFTAAAGSTSGR